MKSTGQFERIGMCQGTSPEDGSRGGASSRRPRGGGPACPSPPRRQDIPDRHQGGKADLFGGVGKTVLITEMIHNMAPEYEGVDLFYGIGDAEPRGGGTLPQNAGGRRAGPGSAGSQPDE